MLGLYRIPQGSCDVHSLQKGPDLIDTQDMAQ